MQSTTSIAINADGVSDLDYRKERHRRTKQDQVNYRPGEVDRWSGVHCLQNNRSIADWCDGARNCCDTSGVSVICKKELFMVITVEP